MHMIEFYFFQKDNMMFIWEVVFTALSTKMEGMSLMSKATFCIKRKIRNHLLEIETHVIIYLQ